MPSIHSIKHITDKFILTKNITVGEGQRCFFVGDVHGMYQQLMEGLNRLKFDFKNDILVSTGDLIDRGTDSLKCLDLVDEPWFYAAYANHEEFALFQATGVFEKEASDEWRKDNGGKWYFETPEHQREELNQHIIKQILKMPVTLKVILPSGKTIGCLHGEMPKMDWDNMIQVLNRKNYYHVRSLIWLRNTFEDLVAFNQGYFFSHEPPETRVEGVDALVLGHNSLVTPMVSENTMWIDTGRYGELTIISAEDVLSAVAKGTGSCASC